jgi:micrococcal nuclease
MNSADEQGKHTRSHRAFAVLVSVAALALLAGCEPDPSAGATGPARSTTSSSAVTIVEQARDALDAPAATATGEVFAVASVTDGDTLRLADGRAVRLAQVDAPETNQCFGSQSTAALKALVAGRSVGLRHPPTGPEKDKYGRTLADVLVDGQSVNQALVRDGAAEWYEQFANEDVDLAGRLQAAEAAAHAAGRGLWSACHAAPPPTTTAPASQAHGLIAPGGTKNCDPAYPDDCIPPAPPDLDCKDIGHAVRVDHAQGDPHGLDADGDGVGCESYG